MIKWIKACSLKQATECNTLNDIEAIVNRARATIKNNLKSGNYSWCTIRKVS